MQNNGSESLISAVIITDEAKQAQTAGNGRTKHRKRNRGYIAMTFDNKDRLTELDRTIKQIKAVFNAFENEYVSHSEKKIALLAVDAGFESYQSMASVLSDLICKAAEQSAELDSETDKETIKAV